MYFDSHAHLSAPPLLPLIEALVQRARLANVVRIVNICTDPESLREGIRLASLYPEILNAGSTTPHDVEKEGESAFSEFAEAARSGHLAAVGETGLDYHYEHSSRPLQKKFLVRYLELALECHLPVIFHCREAFSDLFSIADAYYPGGPAVLHCFTGGQMNEPSYLPETAACLAETTGLSAEEVARITSENAKRFFRI